MLPAWWTPRSNAQRGPSCDKDPASPGLVIPIKSLRKVAQRLFSAPQGSAAVTTISTFHCGLASAACTVARAGEWPGATHCSQAAFMPL